MQGRLWPRSDEERAALLAAGFDVDAKLTHDDLVRGDDVFVAATGVTGGFFLQGVRVSAAGVRCRARALDAKPGRYRL